MATYQVLQNLIFRPTTTLSLLHLTRHVSHLPKPTPSLLQLTRPLSLHVSTIASTNDKITAPEAEGEKVKKMRELEKKKVPELSIKEKKELGSYANGLGDKIKEQQIGKSGVTGNVAFALDETLESKELVKLKILRSCPGELEGIVRLLEESTGSVVVAQIGRTVILYRPSVTRLKAEEKKEQNRRVFEQRRKKFLAAPTTIKLIPYADSSISIVGNEQGMKKFEVTTSTDTGVNALRPAISKVTGEVHEVSCQVNSLVVQYSSDPIEEEVNRGAIRSSGVHPP